MFKISDIILKGRLLILALIIAMIVMMANYANQTNLSYEMAKILPPEHPTHINYENFKSEFGESINTMVIAVQDVDFFSKEHLYAWNKFGDEIERIGGVDGVLNITKLPVLTTDSTKRKFISERWYFPEMTSSELDSSLKVFHNQKIYEGMLYNKDAYSAIMLVDINKIILATPERKNLIDEIVNSGEKYSSTIGKDVKYSGLPYIRTIDSIKVKDEISIFILFTLLITSFILLLFFKSFKATIISIIVVVIGVLFSFGTMGMLGYDISILMALVPPVIIVIGIPNCIFLINKYHTEFKKNKDKDKSLHLMISKIGNITLLTNLTTASGFAAFILTKSETLQEFGLVAAISIIFIFIISILLIPIWFSFFPAPKLRHTQHLDKKWVRSVVALLSDWVKNKRRTIYIVSAILTVVGFIGLSLIKTTGNITDDLSRNGDLYEDLQFFENNFGGVMPLEIIIDTKDTAGLNKPNVMLKVQELQDELSRYSEFSKPVSYIEFVKYANQAYKNDGPKYYTLPQRRDVGRISSLVRKSEEINNLEVKLKDDINSKARITLRMKDIPTPKMDSILNQLKPKIDSIFNPEEYNVVVTGSSRVFLEGTKFLVGNLVYSLLLVILLISIFMAWMFRSFRMVIISLIPNLIPLLLTSAIMGYFSIPIKPSTILVFSIAFGISVDDTIHFLAKYRQELVASHWNIRQSVFNALKETGVSMIYTSVVLFFGFFVFVASDFGGTVALGLLVSITLFFAMLSNLLLLPALLLSLEKLITTKAFKEPFLDIFDEEEDIDLDRLKIKRK
ncbi:MAG: MMPL family transporter [Flavobacteriales bacterium]